MARTRRIGILTGGGDVPGLNSVIKSVVYRSTELGYDVIGIRRGWEGLTHMRPGPEPRPGLRPAARPDQHPDDRPDRRDLAPHVADEPAQDARRRRCRPGSPPAEARPLRDRRGPLRPDPARARQHRGARARLPGGDRRRRHAELRRGPVVDAALPLDRRSPRRWTTTSRAPSTASASRRRSPGPRS